MQKKSAFLKKQYLSFWFFSFLGTAASVLNLAIDGMLGGNELGESALTAITIISPLFNLILFVCQLFISGTVILYEKCVGEFRTKHAQELAGQSLILSAASGCLLALLFFLFRDPYLTYFGCTGEIREYAELYYNWVIPYALILPMAEILYDLVAADGDAVLPMIGSVGGILTNIVLSTVLCRTMGISGLGLASCFGLLPEITVYCMHFLRKSSSLRFRWYFNLKEVKEVLLLSANDALGSVLYGVMTIVINKVGILTCGIRVIPAFSVMWLAFLIFDIFGSVSDACCTFCPIYEGEKNSSGIRATVRLSAAVTVVMGLGIAALLFFGAPLFPAFYGIDSPDIYQAAVTAARIMAIAAVPYGLVSLAAGFYPCLEKPAMGILCVVLLQLVCPLLLAVPLAFLTGDTGIFTGAALSPYLVLLVAAFSARLLYGRKGFPLYLAEKEGEEILSYDLTVTPEAMTEMLRRVEQELKARNISPYKPELLLEELYTRIFEKNAGKKVLSECTLMISREQVRVIVRDDGDLIDFSDADNAVESMNAHVLNCIMEKFSSKNYALTASYNRCGFIFERRELEKKTSC